MSNYRLLRKGCSLELVSQLASQLIGQLDKSLQTLTCYFVFHGLAIYQTILLIFLPPQPSTVSRRLHACWAGQLSRYSDWLRAGRSGDRIPVGGEIFRTCPDRPWGPPSLLYNGYRVFPGGKERPGRDADPSPPSIAVVMKGQSYTSTPPMARTARTEHVQG